MQTSDILSQEVIEKSQIIKEYENEIKELSKNNDLLIIELESYKNNPLETISESNEDTMISLEEQLDTANNRIQDLEGIIYSYEKMDTDRRDVATETNLTMMQLNLTDAKITEKENSYLELLSRFDQLQIEYGFLNDDFEITKEDLRIANEENHSLKSLSQTSRRNSENLQQELIELKTNNESLRNELELYKQKIDVLINDNTKLQLIHKETMYDKENLKSEFNICREKLLMEEDAKKNLEEHVKNLTEKLKNAKMAETSLKLQYDTLNKEVAALNGTKCGLEDSLQKTNSDLAHVQNEFSTLQAENDQLKVFCRELEQVKLTQEQQIKESNQLVGELQKNNEGMICENNKDVPDHKIENISEEYTDVLLESDETKLNEKDEQTTNTKEYDILKLKVEDLTMAKNNLEIELSKMLPLQDQLEDTFAKYTELKQDLEGISNSRDELIKVLRNKHQENVAYHNEIQRLTHILAGETERCKNFELKVNELTNLVTLSKTNEKNDDIEKLIDENNFLKEKCEVLTKNLLSEQAKVEQLLTEKSNPSEAELSLRKKLDRLQLHLIELEEHYTQELIQAEQKNLHLQAKVGEIEEREKSSSTMYTSVSIRANQQVESLLNQLQVMTNERDLLRKQISDSEDVINKQAAALTNLQCVLEQFRKDKEKEVQKETERLRRHINVEKQVQEELKNEISSLKLQLEESKQGLLAASRLSDKLEESKKTISTLKEEVSKVQTQLALKEEELDNIRSNTDGKVDKSLIKNLIIGFVASNNNLNKDQIQILKIIATVLDFSQEEHDKIHLNQGPHGSWLSTFLAPRSNIQNMGQESLSKAFIEFLQNESKPRIVPSLLNVNADQVNPVNSKSTTPRQSPTNLSGIVLPTFADFAQNRNSSSILKDVLKDNS